MSEADKEGNVKTESWFVAEQDETKYNDSEEKDVWRPKADVILSMFKKLSEGGSLPLTWKCPGRRPPDPDIKEEIESEEKMEVDDDESKQEDASAQEPDAFDFDGNFVGNEKLTPKRNPGGNVRTPRTEKRVGRMENILDSLRREQIQRAADREARRAKGSPVAGSRARLLNFGGSPGPRPSVGSPGPRAAIGSPGPRAAIGNTPSTSRNASPANSKHSSPATSRVASPVPFKVSTTVASVNSPSVSPSICTNTISVDGNIQMTSTGAMSAIQVDSTMAVSVLSTSATSTALTAGGNTTISSFSTDYSASLPQVSSTTSFSTLSAPIDSSVLVTQPTALQSTPPQPVNSSIDATKEASTINTPLSTISHMISTSSSTGYSTVRQNSAVNNNVITATPSQQTLISSTVQPSTDAAIPVAGVRPTDTPDSLANSVGNSLSLTASFYTSHLSSISPRKDTTVTSSTNIPHAPISVLPSAPDMTTPANNISTAVATPTHSTTSSSVIDNSPVPTTLLSVEKVIASNTNPLATSQSATNVLSCSVSEQMSNTKTTNEPIPSTTSIPTPVSGEDSVKQEQNVEEISSIPVPPLKPVVTDISSIPLPSGIPQTSKNPQDS